MKEYIIKTTGFEIDYKGESLFKYCEELTRCWDCEYVSIDEFGGGWCDENCREVKPWDFCAWGERKNNE